MPVQGLIFTPLDETEVKKLRKQRLKEIEMWRIFREVLVYFMFFWILYVVCYTNTNPQTYRFQKNIKEMFVSQNLKNDFKNVRNILFSDHYLILILRLSILTVFMIGLVKF